MSKKKNNTDVENTDSPVIEVPPVPEAVEVEETIPAPEVEETAPIPEAVEVEEAEVEEAAPVKSSGKISPLALDMLEAYHTNVREFLSKRRPGTMTHAKPPKPVEVLATELGSPEAVELLGEWTNKMTYRFRPRPGHPLPIVDTPRQILTQIQELLSK